MGYDREFPLESYVRVRSAYQPTDFFPGIRKKEDDIKVLEFFKDLDTPEERGLAVQAWFIKARAKMDFIDLHLLDPYSDPLAFVPGSGEYFAVSSLYGLMRVPDIDHYLEEELVMLYLGLPRHFWLEAMEMDPEPVRPQAPDPQPVARRLDAAVVQSVFDSISARLREQAWRDIPEDLEPVRFVDFGYVAPILPPEEGEQAVLAVGFQSDEDSDFVERETWLEDPSEFEMEDISQMG